jgi:branched-chain amino acid transport system substrate-binding protein
MKCIKGIGILALLSVFLLSGFVVTTPVAAQETIKIGCVFSITGRASFLGEPESKTAKMIAEEVNANGGINGRMIELIIEDSQGDETRAVNAVKGLIRKNVIAIIGPSTSGSTMAVKDICNQRQVPLISCAASEKITSPVTKWVFKTPHKDSHAVQRIYEYMIAHGWKRIGIITGTTGFGAAGRTQLKDKAKDYGISIVADETYGPGDKEMTAQMTKIKAAGVDAIVNWSIVPGQSIVLKNKAQLGMKMPIFQSHGFGNIKYVEAAGDAAEGVLFPASRLLVADDLPYGHFHRAMLKEYQNKYIAKYGGQISSFGGHANDSLYLVLEACQYKGATRTAVRDYIENRQGFLGSAGYFNFSAEDHTGLTKKSFEMLTVKNGKFVRAPK